MKNQTNFRLATALTAAALTACGGGGSTGSAPTPVGDSLPVVTMEPSSVMLFTDETATFTVAATGGTSYQWRKNGINIAGATSASYTTPPATFLDNQSEYSVVVANSAGGIPSAIAKLLLELSADQQAYEDQILSAGGSQYIRWNLNLSGPQVSGINFAQSDSSSLAASPLSAGPQLSTQSSAMNLANSLALSSGTPARVLKGGVILVVPAYGPNIVSYTGTSVKVDSLADDGATVAFSQIRSGYSTMPLSGAVVGAPADLAHWYNSFWSNNAILNPIVDFLANSNYVKYTATNHGDRYAALDCVGVTVTSSVAPCFTGTTISTSLGSGIVSNSDGRTYTLADGAITTVAGVPVFVATLPMPVTATLNSTTQYRTYFQLNGNVYTGSLTKDGQVLGGSYYVSNPGAVSLVDRLTFFQFQIRLNKSARDSIASAMQV